MKHPRSSRILRAAGQAMVEFLVVALVLVPLFLLVPMIGKYLDMKQAAIAASRTLAFECTVRYEDCDHLDAHPSFADEIRTRFFAGDTAYALSNDRPEDAAIQAGSGNPLWVDRKNRPLLENYNDVGIRTDAHTIDAGNALVEGLLEYGPQTFDLELERGLFDARVQVNVAQTNGGQSFIDQLDSLALKMQFHTAILTNAWDADGPGRKSDRCHAERNTVTGRVSEATLCPAPFQAFDATYWLAKTLIEETASLKETTADDYNFHDFIDERWVERVPTTADPVGYPRLETQR